MKTVVAGAMAFIAVSVGLTATQVAVWALDSKPPYDRIFGNVVDEDPPVCGGMANERRGIFPGACVAAEWRIKIYRTDCDPAPGRPVSRVIVDKNGTHEMPKIANVFGRGKLPFSEVLHRPFRLPEWSVPGPAIYQSVPCFVCNPLQRAGITKPICVNALDAHYVVEAN